MIRTPKPPPAPPQVDFDWTPVSVLLSVNVGGNAYPYAHQVDGLTRASDARYAAYTTPTNQLLTFTADVTTTGAAIVRYRWEFGDGTEAFGPVSQKTYLVASPTLAVSLAVLDSHGLEGFATKPLNLVSAAPTRVRQVIRASVP